MIKKYDPNRELRFTSISEEKAQKKPLPHLLFALIAAIMGCIGSALMQLGSDAFDYDILMKTGIFSWLLGLIISIMRQRFIRDD